MKYSNLLGVSTAALLSALSVSAAPNHGEQIAFLGDSASKEIETILRDSREFSNSLAGNFGNVVGKGEKWLKDHLNDPRFKVTTHADLPGYQLRINTVNPTICDSGVKQISGYLDVGDKKHLFFWFFESRNNPKKDPLTLWLNGGPGCSSTTGLLFELGPCLITKNGTDTVHNPYSWNEVSNMIFLDQPVNVGYSYTEGPNVVTSPDAAKDFYAFVQLFYKSFPQYSSQDFNIAGESYAGTYIPNFGRYIWEQNKKLSLPSSSTAPVEKHVPINMKSLLIGNGLSDPYIQFASIPEYSCAPSEHAFVDESQCTTLRNKVGTCQRLQKYCYDSPSRFTCVPAALYCWGMYSPLQATGRNLYDIRKPCDRNGEDGPLCYKELGWIESYLNLPEVKEQLGAPKELNFQSCNMDINRQFLMTGDSQHNSAALLPDMLADGVRVLIYAGNADAMCNAYGNKEWFLALETVFSSDLKHTKERPFNVKGAEAGKLISVGSGAGNYTFLEVEEAGHMVPTDQPEAALRMFSRWIANKPL